MIEINRLLWDDWNITHTARHGVLPEEVEETCQGDFVFFESCKNRFLLVGPTRTGRMLAVILDPEPEGKGVYYPVTARPASRKERRYYQEEKGGEHE